MNSIDNQVEQSRLVNPNLGHPMIINFKDALDQREFEIDLLFISNINSSKILEKSLLGNIYFVPIFEYKWKLKQILEKERLEREKIEKKPTILKRISRIFTSKKKREQRALEKARRAAEEEEERIEKLKHRVIRGDQIKTIVMHVSSSMITGIDSLKYDDYTSPQEYLLRYEVFGDLNKFYKVTLNFEINEEIIEYLKEKSFVMLDIVHQNHGSEVESPDNKNRINYHSLVITNNDWENYSFIQATDLHLADRNDSIYEMVKNWTNIFTMQWAKDLATGNVGKDKNRKKYMKSRKKDTKKSTLPLHKRYINPNNNFRTFIKLANRKVLKNKLDFIVFTGDLIDFSAISTISQDVKKFFKFKYEQSNWRIFKEIVLNFPQEKRRGMISGEEILCPIFTIPGNHDYRPFHYDFRWGSLYRKIGLNASEAIALNDKTIANPISSITKSFRALIGYLSDINPSLNYTMRFGQDLFIFLDTGSDSFRNIRDFISGHPSVTGVSNEQIKYLENIINHQLNEEDEVFLLVHGPPINPKSGFNPFKIFGRKKASNPFKPQLEEYKESKMKSQGYTSTDARIETDFNVKYGAISTNWEKIILFCRDFTKFSFSGHTHSKKEFRLTDPRGNKTKEKFAPPIILRKIENPAAIYYDDYSDLCETPEDIEENAPFVLQTPALGLGGYRNPNYAGGYREIQIVDGKVVSFKVKFINKDFLGT